MAVYRLLINGELVEGASQMEVVNPATGEAFASCARADAGQLDEAVAAAALAFPAWAALGFEERGRHLHAVADRLDARREQFSRLLTTEQGKPLTDAVNEITRAAGVLRSFAVSRVPDVKLPESGRDVTEFRVPLGVVAAITPWNVPVLLLMNKLAPALVMGNTVVVKPAPTTPLTTLLLGEILAEVLPRGVVNIVSDANDLGALLAGHPDVAKIAFTGSTETGRKVLASAAPSIKRVTLELGGNDAAIVLDDVDVEQVAERVFRGAMVNSGQVCVAIKRAYVPAPLYDEFCDILAVFATKAIVGDGFAPDTQYGPLQNLAQFEKVKTYLAEARAAGTVIAGGAPLARPGYFVPPTIVRDVSPDSCIVREEQFGPILPVLSYDNLEDAIAQANDSEYGLAGTVWGRDVARATDVARRIATGTVWVNHHMDILPTIPVRGVRQSGIGAELGQAGVEEYTQARILNVARL